VAWSPDGTRIASGGDTITGNDHTVRVWNVSDGGNVFTYRGHSAPVLAVAWKGTRIASADADGIVKVWDAIDGGHVLTYRGHSRMVNALAWSPNGTHIASGSGYGDETVQVWDAATGTHVYTYRGL
jgi:WD40 repeat protein